MDEVTPNKSGWSYFFIPTGGVADTLNVKMTCVNAGEALHGAHSHNHDELFIVVEGEAIGQLNGEDRLLHTGDSMYCPSGSSHSIRRADPDSQIRYLMINRIAPGGIKTPYPFWKENYTVSDCCAQAEKDKSFWYLLPEQTCGGLNVRSVYVNALESHCHGASDGQLAIFVLEGTADITVDGNSVNLPSMSVCYVPAGSSCTIKAADGPLRYIEAWTEAHEQSWQSSGWPVLKHYDADHLYRIALPLGGIGTGTVSLGGRGELRDWEIENVPGKGFSTVTIGNDAPFFAIYTKQAEKEPQTRLLAGPLYSQEYLHCEGRPVNHHGLPRFKDASFDAAYPFGQVSLSDPAMPVKVRIKGFNPLIPGDSEASGLPVAVLSYEVTNIGNVPVEVAVCGAIRNFIGRDSQKFYIDRRGDKVPTCAGNNFNEYRESGAVKGIYFDSSNLDKDDPALGNFALTTDFGGVVTFRTYTTDNNWSNSLLNFWDDLSDDGLISNPKPSIRASVGNSKDPMGALCAKATLAAGETRTFNFFITWSFPNRYSWSETIVGNYYCRKYPESWDSALDIIPRIKELEGRTLAFVNALLDSSLPEVVKEAALFNLSTLRSQTVFRIGEGHMMGWEGVSDSYGSCAGSCTHVWNYEVATPFLFGDLARTMRDVEFGWSMLPDGQMDFRANLPLGRGPDKGQMAADGQMGCVMKLYREWQLSGDDAFLAKYWPACKAALSFAWVEHGWDGNCDGVMEGSQHNTMDVNYFGPNPQMQFWYMGALRAAEEMALAMKDKAFARKCRSLFEKGGAWGDAFLFNGEYYEQKITDPETFEFLPEDSDLIPPYQLGKACLVDQLVGQYMAHICGLGYLGDRNHILSTLHSVMKYNFVEDFSSHFNNMRSYVLGNESGLLMASWPKGRLEVPFPYFPESMTGFEYTAAVGMIYEGMTDEALKCIKAIRDRFDGARRNPFDEPECGHHYARAMASWAAVIALGEFNYSGVNKSFSITGRPGTWFWSNGSSWGSVVVTEDSATLNVIEGGISLKTFSCGGRTIKKAVEIPAASSYTWSW